MKQYFTIFILFCLLFLGAALFQTKAVKAADFVLASSTSSGAYVQNTQMPGLVFQASSTACNISSVSVYIKPTLSTPLTFQLKIFNGADFGQANRTGYGLYCSSYITTTDNSAHFYNFTFPNNQCNLNPSNIYSMVVVPNTANTVNGYIYQVAYTFGGYDAKPQAVTTALTSDPFSTYRSSASNYKYPFIFYSDNSFGCTSTSTPQATSTPIIDYPCNANIVNLYNSNFYGTTTVANLIASSSNLSGDESASSSDMIYTDCSLISDDDLGQITQCMKTASDGSKYVIYHVPFFIWVIIGSIFLFIAYRLIIEFVIRWRNKK